MATATPSLAQALRTTAARLREGAGFTWGHMGSCNCGHLAQTVTQLSAAEIHRAAMERYGDWSTQTLDHCPASGLTIDHVFDALLELGLTHTDLRRLEHLSDHRVLARVPSRHLRRQDVRHAIQYFEAWAELIEEEVRSSDSSSAVADPAEQVSRSTLERTVPN